MVEVVVEFDYTAVEEDELTIKPGDVIKDVTKMEGGWWEGSLNGKRGMFPDNFVKEVKRDKGPLAGARKESTGHVSNLAKNLDHGGIKMGPLPVVSKGDNKPDKKKTMAKVKYPYNPQHTDELALVVGELVEVTKQEEEGWWEGIKNGVTGVFPSNFVEIVSDDKLNETNKADEEVHEIKGKKVKGVGFGNIFEAGAVRLKSASREDSKEETRSERAKKELPAEPKAKKVISPPAELKEPPALPPKEIKEPKPVERAKVLYSYKAENVDELTLTEGDIIVVLEKELEDSGWWKGELNGKIGVFPDNFVELLPPEEIRPKKPLPPSVPSEPSGKPEPPLPSKREDIKEEKASSARKPAQPPPVCKKPVKHDDQKLIAQTDDMKAKEMDTDKTVQTPGEIEPVAKHSHITAGKARVPEQRLPKNRPHANKLDDPTAPESRHRQPSAPNTLPQQKRINPLQASEHPIAVSSGVILPASQEELTPPVIKEREDKKVAPVRAARPPPPTPTKSVTSPTVSPRSPDSETKGQQVDNSMINNLKKELEELKANTVSRADYEMMQQDMQHMREDMDKLRTHFQKKIFDLMKEVDDEKKIRLNMQVEIDRINKLVFPDDD